MDWIDCYKIREWLDFTNHPVSDDPVMSRMIALNFNDAGKGKRADFFNLKEFVRENKFDLLLELYDRVKDLSMASIREEITRVNKALTEVIDNNRIAEIYAIIIAVGNLCGFEGLFRVSADEISNLVATISENKYTLNEVLYQAYKGAMEQIVAFKDKTFKPMTIKVLELNDFVKYLKENNIVDSLKCNVVSVGRMVNNHPRLKTERKSSITYVLPRD